MTIDIISNKQIMRPTKITKEINVLIFNLTTFNIKIKTKISAKFYKKNNCILSLGKFKDIKNFFLNIQGLFI